MAFCNAWQYGLILVTNKLDVVENQLTFTKYKCRGFDEVFARFFWHNPKKSVRLAPTVDDKVFYQNPQKLKLSTITLSKSIFSAHTTLFPLPIRPVNISFNNPHGTCTTSFAEVCLKFWIQMREKSHSQHRGFNWVCGCNSLARRETFWAMPWSPELLIRAGHGSQVSI